MGIGDSEKVPPHDQPPLPNYPLPRPPIPFPQTFSQQVLSLPRADHLQESVELALLTAGVREHEALAEQVDQRTAAAQQAHDSSRLRGRPNGRS